MYCGNWERLESCPAVNVEHTAVTVIERGRYVADKEGESPADFHKVSFAEQSYVAAMRVQDVADVHLVLKETISRGA